MYAIYVKVKSIRAILMDDMTPTEYFREEKENLSKIFMYS